MKKGLFILSIILFSINVFAQGEPIYKDKHIIKSFDEMEQFLHNQQELAKNKKHNILVKTTLEFAPESATFFIAVGGLMYVKLITDYAENPISLEQHIASLKDPLSHLSFYNFMLANRAATQPLMAMIQSPKLRTYIPYLGMTAGMIASNLTHEVFADENLKICAKGMFGEVEESVKKKACRSAHKNWISTKKPIDWTPGILSMLGATYIMGKGQQLAVLGLAKGIQKFGLELSLFVSPTGGFVITSGRWLLKVAHIAGFLGLSEYIQSKFEPPFKNFIKSDELRMKSVELEYENFSHRWDEKFLEKLEDYSEAVQGWKEFNLQKPLTAHLNWQQNLMNLTSMYLASQNFYFHFFNEVSKRNEIQKTKPITPFESYFFSMANDPNYILTNSRPAGPLSILDMTFPFNGLIPKGAPADRDDIYLNMPEMVAMLQKASLADGIDHINKQLPKLKLTIGERKFITENLALINSKDISKKAEGLQKLGRSIGVRELTASNDFNKLMAELFKIMGKPKPTMEVGKGYLEAYEKFPAFKQFNMGVEPPRTIGMFQTDDLMPYFIASMACGPDVEKAGNVVKQSRGYSANFLPPSITMGHPSELISKCKGGGGAVFQADMFHTRLGNYNGLLDFVKNNVKPSIINGTKNHSLIWWEIQIESQVHSAFDEYAKKYNSIVVDLVKGLKAERSMLNLSEYDNSPLTASARQAEMYIKILTETSKDKAITAALGKKVIAAIVKTANLFSNININEGSGLVQANISGGAITKQIEALKATINDLAADQKVALQMVDVKQVMSEKEKVVQPDPNIKPIVDHCIKALQAIAGDFSNYLLVAKATDYMNKNEDTNNNNKNNNKECKKIISSPLLGLFNKKVKF